MEIDSPRPPSITIKARSQSDRAVAPSPTAENAVASNAASGKCGRPIACGRVLGPHGGDDLIGTEPRRLRLQYYFPAGNSDASFYATTRDRFWLGKDAGVVTASTAIDEM